MPAIVSRFVQVHVFRRGSGGIEFLLLQRADDEPLYPGLWQMVTGTIESGERAADTARRELVEETGFGHARIDVVPYVASFYSAADDAVHMIPVFAAEVPADAHPLLSSEHQHCEWLPYQEARRRLAFPGHHAGLDICHAYLLGVDRPGTALPPLR